jgi:hypothetical protein
LFQVNYDENNFSSFEDSQITIFSKNTENSQFLLETSNDIETNDDETSNIEEHNEKYAEAITRSQATFQLDPNDWKKLKQLQHGHRFKRGEWEDYFVVWIYIYIKYFIRN